jgi:hypothetical protein
LKRLVEEHHNSQFRDVEKNETDHMRWDSHGRTAQFAVTSQMRVGQDYSVVNKQLRRHCPVDEHHNFISSSSVICVMVEEPRNSNYDYIVITKQNYIICGRITASRDTMMSLTCRC